MQELQVQEVPFDEVSMVPVLSPLIVMNLLFPKVIPMRVDVVPEDLLSQEVPLSEVSIFPELPTATNNPVVVNPLDVSY